MSTHQRKYFSGSSLDSALMQAARYHGIAPEEVAYQKVEKKHGFLRTRKAVVIEVDPDAPRRAVTEDAASAPPAETIESAPPAETIESAPPAETIESSPPAGTAASAPPAEISEPGPLPETATAPPPAETSESGPPAESTEPGDEALADDERLEPLERRDAAGEEAPEADLIEAAKAGLEDLLEFAQLEITSTVEQGEGELEIELTGPHRERLIEDRGNLLLSIQHLMPRLIRGRAGRSIPCHVDSENFHESREVELRRLAEEAAAEVRQRRQSRTLPPMNPAERRIIHVTLAEDKDLKTESQGRGFFKRVTISPAVRRPRGFDRYS